MNNDLAAPAQLRVGFFAVQLRKFWENANISKFLKDMGTIGSRIAQVWHNILKSLEVGGRLKIEGRSSCIDLSYVGFDFICIRSIRTIMLQSDSFPTSHSQSEHLSCYKSAMRQLVIK